MLYVIRITTFIASQDFGNEILFKIYISFHRVRDFDSIYNVAIIIIEISILRGFCRLMKLIH